MAVLREQVGRRIRELRQAAGWTQTELAARVGDLNYRYVGAVERGEVNTTLDTLDKLAGALDARPYQLFLFTSDEKLKDQAVNEELIQELLNAADENVKQVLVRIMKDIVDMGR